MHFCFCRMIAINIMLVLTTAVFAITVANQDPVVPDKDRGAVPKADSCLTTKDCQAVVSIRVWVNEYTFQLWAVGGNYVAVGLSDDTMMGNDSIVECVSDSAAGAGKVSLYASFNNGKTNTREANATGLTLDVEASSYDPDTKEIYCKFIREEVTVFQGVEFDLFRTQFHLLLAAGTTATDSSIGFHDIGKGANSDKGWVEEYGDYQIPEVRTNMDQ